MTSVLVNGQIGQLRTSPTTMPNSQRWNLQRTLPGLLV